MNVSNRKCIRSLSRKSMKAQTGRNIIAIIAIMLTAILFTAVFTVALSINDSIQQANFRQVGGYAHGTFKYLTEEQFHNLKDDPLIKEYSLRIFTGMPSDSPFQKSHVEVGYSDAKSAKWMFIDPIEGRLPTEGTREAATDTRVLNLLGVEPKLGTEFTMTFHVDGTETTETFILCGWWEYDEAIVANHVLIPQSRTEELFTKLDTQFRDGMTGTWNMDIMLDNAFNIERDIIKILENHGYTVGGKEADHTISIGVNWGYTGAQLADSIDPLTMIAIIVLLLLIVFTGYLIIYNVFQISVTGDVRFYGLLKTIGVTGRQIKRIIRIQALSLSFIGIPLGLIAGWFVGVQLTPIILSQLDGIHAGTVPINPVIFVGAAIFSLFTVAISACKPGKMAAMVSPVEAVRYTDVYTSKKQLRKTKSGASLPKMALANLNRNRRKTTVTMVSLSLAVVLLNLVFTFTNGFDMDKYLRNVVSDFIIADAGYFSVTKFFWEPVAEEVIDQLHAQGGIADGGRVYDTPNTGVLDFVTEEIFYDHFSESYSSEMINSMMEKTEKLDGKLAADVQLLGMEDFALSKLGIVDGDISKLNNPESYYIAAVYYEDDYNNVQMDSHWAKIGDKVIIRYIEEWEYYDYATDKVIEVPSENIGWYRQAKKYRDVEYEVAALVTVPHTISYRYYTLGSDSFILGSEPFLRDSGNSSIMLYTYDTTDEATADMESFMQNLTKNIQPQYDYESKKLYEEEFNSFRDMFTILGSVLCFIIGLVGVLNFLNAILTSIIARHREFAVLQSVGMTGKQLKTMLVYEGLLYTLGAVIISVLLCVVTGPLLRGMLENMYWFFSYRFTILPALAAAPVFTVLGIILPLTAYHSATKKSLIERLREE